ncbi:MAG TPA: glycosyltransferase family 4 protein [Anaeromyxobacteraceae bacterium]|nr:glycosyltransferase family 4 protein [Anaeromyxobacteraceae bacterium]
MKVLILNQFFHPDLSATAQIAADLAEDLEADGFEVTALAARGSYLGGRALAARERYRGVEIVRVPTTSFGKRSIIHRAVDYASFYGAATFELLRMPKQDAIIALTTPPLIATAALLVRGLRGTRLVLWVMDVYPEVAVALGTLRPSSLAARAMAAASRIVLSRADHVVVLGEAMRERVIKAGAVPRRVELIPNWADAHAVTPIPHEKNPLRSVLAGDARCLVMYSGNMGRGHDMASLLEAARQLRHRSDIRFAFLGDGAGRPEVEAAVRELPNVSVGDYQARERLSLSLSAADLHLVSLRPEHEGLMEPSKLYGIMAAGRPAIFVGPLGSEVARTIVREGCGIVLSGKSPADIADSIVALAEDERTRMAMGARGREALTARYARPLATSSFARLLRSLFPSAADGRERDKSVQGPAEDSLRALRQAQSRGSMGR